MTSTRRRSMMPSLAAPKPPIAASTRRRSVMPPPAKPRLEEKKTKASAAASKPVTTKLVAPPKLKAKSSTNTSKPQRKDARTKQAEEFSSFVSAENFDFDMLQDVSGPMTRSRRTSVYGKAGQQPLNLLPTPKRGRGRPPMAVKTSTTIKAKKSTPVLKVSEPLTPIVELKRLKSDTIKTSGDRRKAAAIDPISALPPAFTPATKKGTGIIT